MRFISSLVSLALFGGGAYWVNDRYPEVKTKILELVNSGYFHTLEVRYSAKQIMENERAHLLKGDKHKFLEPTLKFRPYLCLEVKYSDSRHSSSEGMILWDLVDGEMVINAHTWEKTHGFADCLNANTEKHEFKILNLLAQRGGAMDRNGLIKNLHLENDILDAWIDSCRNKKLIVQSGNDYRLHLQNPKLTVIPETHIEDPLVTKSFKNAERVAKRFTSSQIKRMAESAFGNDFAIRNTSKVFLPFYSITVQNPDGSLRTSHWNALNGKCLSNTILLE